MVHVNDHATDSPMFSLALILPMFDVRCVNRPNSNVCTHVLCFGFVVMLQNFEQNTEIVIHNEQVSKFGK